MDLVTSIYEITKCLPLDEKYGLSSQMRRCAISIPSNIAEGAARQSGPEFKRFLFLFPWILRRTGNPIYFIK